MVGSESPSKVDASGESSDRPKRVLQLDGQFPEETPYTVHGEQVDGTRPSDAYTLKALEPSSSQLYKRTL